MAPADATVYESFEVRIGTTPVGYGVTVSQSAAGDAAGPCHLDLQAPSLQRMLAAVAGGRAREDTVLDLGTTLFAALFHGAVATAYWASLNSARARDHGLRIRLTIEPPELAALPWEYLFDPQEDAFLAISPQTALIRYLPVQTPAAAGAFDPPLRVLVVSAAPQDFPLVDAETGARAVREALGELIADGKAVVEIVEHATAAAITQAMRRVRPHIFHFIGHGTFENDRAFVLLEDEAGNGRPVSDRTFREFLTGHNDTRAVVLSACQSATVSAQQPMVGLAPRLLQRQVAAVVAMQYPIPQSAAFVFARDFYRSVALGYPLEAAVSEGRRGIYLEGGGETEWGIPVLFLRTPDGALFAGEAAAAAPAAAAPAVTMSDVGAGAMVVTGPVTGIAAYNIWGTAISNVTGDVHITQAAPVEVQPAPPPAPTPLPPFFVGREQELAHYGTLLDRNGSIIITGMSGVGKTAFAAKLLAQSVPPEKTFWHTFRAGEGVDLLLWELAGFAAWHGKADLWQLLQRAPQPPPHEALVAALLNTLRGGGYLLALDDVHFVDDDPALAASIKRLAAALAAGDLALIATADRMPALAQYARAEALGGMSAVDAGTFLGARGVTLPASLAAELHARTGGNVVLLALAADMLQHAPDPQRAIQRLAEEDNIMRYLLKEVDQGLTADERQVMVALALLGNQPGTVDAIAALLDRANPRRVLLGLSDRYLVNKQEGANGPEYLLAPILQAFYYGELGRSERQKLHLRAGAFFAGEEPNPLRAAGHFFDGADYPRAAQLAVGNMRAIVNRGQVRGLRLLLEGLTRDQLAPLLWAEVQLALAEVCRLTSDHAAVIPACSDALRTLDQLPDAPALHVMRARALRNLGLARQYENPQEAYGDLQRGLAALEAASPTTPGAGEERGLLRLHSGSLLIALGEFDAAQAAVEAALGQLPEDEEFLRALAYRSLGTIHSYRGELDAANQYNEQSLALSRRLHDDLNVQALLHNMGIDKEIAGDWEGAAAAYRESLHLAHQLESVVEQTRVANSLAILDLRRGNYAAAQSALAHALHLARTQDIPEGVLYLLHTQAELAISRGEWGAAAESLAEAERLAEELDAPYVLVEIAGSQAQVALAGGDVSAARVCAEKARDLGDELQLPLEAGKARRILGLVYAAEGGFTAAFEVLAQSAERLADEPYEAARTNVEQGALLQQLGDPQGAALLQAAMVQFAALGAQPELARAAALLDRGG